MQNVQNTECSTQLLHRYIHVHSSDRTLIIINILLQYAAGQCYYYTWTMSQRIRETGSILLSRTKCLARDSTIMRHVFRPSKRVNK